MEVKESYVYTDLWRNMSDDEKSVMLSYMSGMANGVDVIRKAITQGGEVGKKVPLRAIIAVCDSIYADIQADLKKIVKEVEDLKSSNHLPS